VLFATEQEGTHGIAAIHYSFFGRFAIRMTARQIRVFD
jgi:hypothetical protein